MSNKYPFKVGDIIHNIEANCIFTIIGIRRNQLELQMITRGREDIKILDMRKKHFHEQLYSDKGTEVLRYYPVLTNKPVKKQQ